MVSSGEKSLEATGGLGLAVSTIFTGPTIVIGVTSGSDGAVGGREATETMGPDCTIGSAGHKNWLGKRNG